MSAATVTRHAAKIRVIASTLNASYGEVVDHFGRVRLTNPDKVLYPATGTTKAEVFDYYVAIADVMLPHIAGRPVTRKRWPNGTEQPSLFEKQLASSAPEWLHRGAITHKSGTTTYPIVDTHEDWLGSGLVSLTFAHPR